MPKNLGWKTVTGALLALLAYLLDPAMLAVLPAKVANVLMALGTFLTVIGLRHAVAKSTIASSPIVVGVKSAEVTR